MKKTKFILIPIIFILVAVVIVFFGFSELNILPNIIPVSFFQSVGKEKPEIKSNEEIIDELKNLYLANETKATLADNMNAIWVNLNTDISAEATDGTEAVKYAIYSDMDYYRNFIPDTVFVVPDTSNKYSSLAETDGSNFDILGYFLFYVNHIGCSPVLVVDDSFFSQNKLNTSLLDNYLSKYSFNSVLLSVDSVLGTDNFVNYTQNISAYIRLNYPKVNFGVEIHSDNEALFADRYVIEVFENNYIDFGYVDINSTTGNTEFPYESIAIWWNYFSDYYKIPLYCEHRLDLIFSNDKEWGLSTEINSQLKALYNCFSFDGSCFYGVSSLINKKALARDLAIFLNDVNGDNQDAFFISSVELNNGSAKFNGHTATENLSVFCNDTYIKSENKAFEESFVLHPGLNEFVFSADAAEYQYDIINNADMFNSFYPAENISIGTDFAFSPYAVCPADSEVFAVINGSYFEMTPVENTDNTIIPQGYEKYSCSISFYAKDFSSGKLSMICFNNQSFDVIECSEVFLSIASLTLSGNHNKESISNSEISPFNDQNLGKSLMCMIKYDNTKLLSTVDDYDTYHPDVTALPDGTLDYVEKITCSEEGYLRYELKSGLNVYGVDSVLIYDGFNLPTNKITFNNITNAENSIETISFNTDWKAPVTVTQQLLNYEKGYESFSFNINEYNAQYVDVNFYYSANIDNLSSINLNNSSLFSRYEVVKQNAEKTILRLYLKSNGAYYGCDVKYDSDNNLLISFKNITNSGLTGKTVMLDAGHGGISMVGTANSDNTVSEASVTLAITLKVKAYLEAMGAKVIMTRTMDSSLSLSQRTDMCVTNNPDIFVSIHCDGSAASSQSGTHTFYFTPYSQPLAASIHNRLVDIYSESIYVESDENYKNIDRKIKFYPFYVTRVDNCPSVLVETGFLTNYVESHVLANPVNQDYIGRAIADGINDYFNLS